MAIAFDSSYYLEQYPDVAEAVENGIISAEEHWEMYGADEGRNPNAVFNTEEYLAANPDVAASGMNPLDHFLQYGAGEGRAPSAAYQNVAANFDNETYLAANPDVAAAIESGAFASGYEHWVVYGQFEEGVRTGAQLTDGTPASEAIGEGEVASDLTEALAILAEGGELPEGYELTDATVDLGALAVADVTTSLEKAQAIVDGAANADELELDATYSVEDTLSNLLVAEEVVLEGAASYTVDASVPRVNNAATVAEAAAALSLVAGAANADELVVEDLYVWKIEDSAANIVAAIEDGAVTSADEVRVAFEEGDQLTVEQAEALNGLENLVGELPPVDAEGAVLAGLQALETAQNNESNFLEANADNELVAAELAADGDAPAADPANPENAEVAAAIRQADTDADQAVVDAENAVLDAEADLAGARAEEASVANTSQAVIDDIDALNLGTRLSDANLAAAATEAQADVNADERVYDAEGNVVAATSADLVDVYLADVDGDGTADDYITADFADVAQVTTVDLSSLDSNSTFSITVNGTEYTTAWDSNLATTGDALATEVAKDSAVTAAYGTDTLTITAANAGEVVTISNTGDGGTATNTTEAFDTSDFIANNEPVGVADSADVKTGADVGKVESSNVVTDDTATAAELQAADASTAAAVDNARAAQSDADLLTDINTAINAHIAAGGENVDASAGESLLDLRTDINTAIANVAEGETLQLTKDNGVFDTTIYTGKAVLKALANAGNAGAAVGTVNDNGVLTVEQATAPETGEGTWVKGEETGQGTGEFTFTYEPSAEEQALVGAVKDVEGRVELLTAEDSADTAFGTTVTGDVFNTIEALQEERDALIEAVGTAEGELTDAQATADATQQLVDQLDALEQQVADAEAALTDSAEEGGLGVNLVDFVDNAGGQNATATATAEDDVILFSAAEDGDSIVNFGAAGEDRLYVGTDFTINNVEAGVNVAGTAQGDASVQEMFVQQTAGGDTVLSFENEAFAGSATSGADLTQVTLTGVTGDVSVSDDGFLTVA